MKPIVSVSAAMLLALSLTACGPDDDQNTAAGGTEAAQTNTASENADHAATEAGSGSQMNGSEDDMTNEAAAGGSGMQGNNMNSASSEDMPKAAIAVLHGTEGNADITATIRFTPQDGGIAYTTEAQNLPEGGHGYHIHLYGDCSSGDGKSAGTHFNLQGSSKNPPKDIDRITGDLGNIDGGTSASHEGTLDNASLTGAKSIIGRGVIIHEKPNDPSQPPIGAAGARLACGVIGIAEAQSGAAGGDASASDASTDASAEAEATTGFGTGSNANSGADREESGSM